MKTPASWPEFSFSKNLLDVLQSLQNLFNRLLPLVIRMANPFVDQGLRFSQPLTDIFLFQQLVNVGNCLVQIFELHQIARAANTPAI